jgi:sugar phosphate isomerase/epimerase
MIKGLTKAGIGQVGTFEEFVTKAAQYGFGAVDTDGASLAKLIEEKGLEGAQAFLRAHNIQIGSIGLPVEWRESEEKFKEGLSKLVEAAAAASKLGCTACCTYILPSTDYNAAHFMALATRRLKSCAQILKPYGIRLGLEFVGPHHLRTRWKNHFIWDQQSTLDWIAAIDETNVGLLYDAFHWYTNGLTVDDILSLQAAQIVHVHINDARDVPIEEVLDNDRIYPGEGVIDLAGFLRAFNQIGYTGSVSQEILTQAPPTEESDLLLKRSAEGFAKVYQQAGLE